MERARVGDIYCRHLKLGRLRRVCLADRAGRAGVFFASGISGHRVGRGLVDAVPWRKIFNLGLGGVCVDVDRGSTGTTA